MTAHAKGTFDVKVTPKPADDPGGPFGRYLLDKQFHGDLDARSSGHMLAWGTGADSTAAGVALELVTGVLHGRHGSFVLQHNSTIVKRVPSMTVTVVPDSGTGQLTGLTGTMTIGLAGGGHSYTFDYTIGVP